MKYTVDLAALPFTMFLPIVEWCVANGVAKDKTLGWIQAWHEKDFKVDDFILEMDEQQALIFCLKWNRYGQEARD